MRWTRKIFTCLRLATSARLSIYFQNNVITEEIKLLIFIKYIWKEIIGLWCDYESRKVCIYLLPFVDCAHEATHQPLITFRVLV